MTVRRSVVGRGKLCPTCGRYLSRDVVTDALIIKARKILMVKRAMDPFGGYWALVGGYSDWDETVEEGVLREVKEEIGLDAKIERFFGIYSDPKRDYKQNVAIVFVLSVTSSNFKLQKEEVSEARWFDLNSLPSKIAFDHRKIIEDYRRSALYEKSTE